MRTLKHLTIILLVLIQTPVFAYIGPGAGIPFVSSFIGFVVSVFLVIVAILFWPIRKLLKKKKKPNNPEDDNTQ